MGLKAILTKVSHALPRRKQCDEVMRADTTACGVASALPALICERSQASTHYAPSAVAAQFRRSHRYTL